MLIWCSRNISLFIVESLLKRVVLNIFVETVILLFQDLLMNRELKIYLKYIFITMYMSVNCHFDQLNTSLLNKTIRFFKKNKR